MGADDARTWRVSLGLIVLLGAVAALALLPTFQVGSFFDDATYVILAEALGSGQGYRLIHLPSAPPGPTFPPGWPYILAPLAPLVDGWYVPLQLGTIALALLAIPLIFRLAYPRLGMEGALTVAALVAVNPWLAGNASRLMSESAYTSVSLLALLLFTTGRRRTVGPLLLALLAATIRSVGWTLVVALGVGTALRLLRGRRRGARRIVVPLVLGALAGAALLAPEALLLPPLYREHLAFVAPRLADYLLPWRTGAPLEPSAVATLLLPLFDLRLTARLLPAPLLGGLALALLGVTLVGFVAALRRPTVTEPYVVLYTLLIVVWTGFIAEFQPRQLLPVLPLFYLYLLLGVRVLAEPLRDARGRTRAVRLLVLGLAVALLVRVVHERGNTLRERIPDLATGTAVIRNRAPEDAIVVTADPAPDYLYLRRRTLAYPASTGDIDRYLTDNGVDYVVLRPSLGIDGVAVVPRDAERERLRAALEADPVRYRLIAQEDEVTVYEVAE